MKSAVPSRSWSISAFAAILLAPLSSASFATAPVTVASAREHYQASKHSETDREQFILALARVRDQYAHAGKTAEWQAIDAEIRKNPASKSADGHALSKTLIGKWASPRHEYEFRADGIWSMLPADPGATRGHWAITGNQFTQSLSAKPTRGDHYTIILLTAKNFIYTDGKVVYYEARLH